MKRVLLEFDAEESEVMRLVDEFSTKVRIRTAIFVMNNPGEHAKILESTFNLDLVRMADPDEKLN